MRLVLILGLLLSVAPRGVPASHGSSEPRGFRLQADDHLRTSGTRFVRPDGTSFRWRGISAFRLVEFVAHGNEAKAGAYLRWAASNHLNVVRVFAMMQNIFELRPEEGRKALPRLLDIAARHGLYVEVVALVGTATATIDVAAQVKAVGDICAAHANCVLELANEPGHPSQSKALHDPEYLRRLATLVPAGVPVSLGSVDFGAGYGAGTYVTWHPPRTTHWVERLDEGRRLLGQFGKPLVADEPMGAADKAAPGRRDDDPARFRAAGAKLEALGLGATFHYDGGMHARIPTPSEAACLDAWLAGLES